MANVIACHMVVQEAIETNISNVLVVLFIQTEMLFISSRVLKVE